jgi:hypothetical protein
MSQPVRESTGDDRSMTPTYISVVAIQVAVTIALWWFGRVFSR